MSFIEGYLIGLATVIFFGPVFFTILNGTLQFGSRAGLIVTAGIITSDIACVSICSLASPFVASNTSQLWITIVGCGVLIGMGIKYLIKPIKYTEKPIKLHPKQYAGFFSKGFIVNFTSPFTFAFWLFNATEGVTHYLQTLSFVSFLGAIVLGILTIDILKVYLAGYLKKLLQPKMLRLISTGCGVVLIGFGLYLVWYIYAKLWV